MDRQSRDLNWDAVERAFSANAMPLGTPCPIAVMLEVRTEDGVAAVRSALQRDGFEAASVEKKWWPFGRRWRVAARMPTPQPIAQAEINRWLDRLENRIRPFDADVGTWIPIRPGA